MDDADDGLMLNFAAAAAGGSTAAKKPKMSAKSRFAQKRNVQNARKANGTNVGPSAQAPAPSRSQVTQAAPSPSRPATVPSRSQPPSTIPLSAPSASSSAAPRQAAFLTGLAKAQSSSKPAATQRSAAASQRTSAPSARASTSASSTFSSAPASGSSARTSAGGVISALFPANGVLEDKSANVQAGSSKPKYDPTNAPSAGDDFASCGLDPLLVYHLSSKMKIGSNPTSIQKVALPHLLHPGLDRDILIQAQTGSGKTLTYLLPIIQSLLPLCEESFIDRGVGTLAIVLAPTRELARQIYEVLEKLVSLALSLKEQTEGAADQDNDAQVAGSVRRTRWLVPGLLSGGSTKNHEKQRLRKGCPIVVSTPGRLLDHLQNTSSFDVGKCRWLVLDEADRLLEMGFEEQLTGIVKALDGRRRLACAAAREAMPGYMDGLSQDHPDYIKDDNVMDTLGMTWWAHQRRVVLCSATLDENVQVLAGKTLINPKILRAGKDDDSASNKAATGKSTDTDPNTAAGSSKTAGTFAAPAQLQQSFVSTPPKLRLVTLLALLRAYISRARRLVRDASEQVKKAGAGRVIVFMSCTDSVDFHYAALGGAKMNAVENDPNAGDNKQDEEDDDDGPIPTSRISELIPGVPIFRLHGSMSQQDRIKSLKGFASTKAEQEGGFKGSILLCTSVASRGLDLPDVGCVIQLDPPTEGGIEEYLHRVGRTARVGRPGESWLMVLPQEIGWVDNMLEAHVTIQSSSTADASDSLISSKNAGNVHKIQPASIERVLQDGFGGAGGTLEYQSRATEVQLAFERWVLSGEKAAIAARRGFLSHVRAYATHPAEEKQYFNVRALHLGHLAKAFALREAPKNLGAKSASIAAIPRPTSNTAGAATAKRGRDGPNADDSDSDSDDDSDGGSDYESRAAKKAKSDGFELDKAALAKLMAESISSADPSGRSSTSNRNRLVQEALEAASKKGAAGKGGKHTDAEARMYAKVRALGRMSKKDGVLAAHGADEFQIA
ncbi:DEAD-domain-containing protein [Testicularia cyperi]|uniref:ATP-dependent RNA helicase n=1 Tax=Testicularia cyperi TaxID=1882483 RepID=A0A317XTJ6_9BASI|nr:DEAD-domain-containing protein [Testicularia cyperi]